MYNVLRRILFFFSPEWVHYFSMNCMKLLCSTGFTRKLISLVFSLKDSRLRTTLIGLEFKNPVGLGAGFDKNAKYLRELEALGFGSVEIGTVTPLPQDGNDTAKIISATC